MKIKNIPLFIVLILALVSMLGACGGEDTAAPANNPGATSGVPFLGQGGKETTGPNQSGQTGKEQAVPPPTTITSGKDIFSALVLDSANIYFISPVENDKDNFPVMGIYKVPKTGEKVNPDLVYKGIYRGNAYFTDLIGDEDSLYFLMRKGDTDDLVRLDKKSWVPTTLYSFDASNTDKAPDRLAQDSDSIYWLSRYNVEVVKIAKKGGSPVTLVPANQEVSKSNGLSRRAIAVDSANVYYLSGEKLTLERVDKKGGAPVKLMEFDREASMPTSLVIDDSSLYWLGAAVDPKNPDIVIQGIVKLPKNGGNPGGVTVKGAKDYEFDPIHFDNPDLFLSGSNFYWSGNSFKNPNKKEVKRVGVTGGTYNTLSLVDEGPSVRFAADDKNLYWVAGSQTFTLNGGNLILRTPK